MLNCLALYRSAEFSLSHTSNILAYNVWSSFGVILRIKYGIFLAIIVRRAKSYFIRNPNALANTTKTEDKPLIELDAKDLLQTNATIIAGVLILLTLVASVTDNLKLPVKIIMGFAITPFLLSCIALFATKLGKKSLSSKARLSGSMNLTVAGLLYLTFAVIFLLATI